MSIPDNPRGIVAKLSSLHAAAKAELERKETQTAYQKSHKAGKYAQLLPTSTAPPKDGATKPPDTTSKPPGGADKRSWADLGITLAVALECSHRCTEYVMPDGTTGLQLLSTVELEGNTWVKSDNIFGAETYRAHDWALVEDPGEV